MTIKTQRELCCDECSARELITQKYERKERDWMTVAVWPGIREIDSALTDGPRGMRDELESLSRQFVQLCPGCVATLGAFIVESLPKALGSHFGHYPELPDDDEIPF